MGVLLIHAHPVETSYSALLRDVVQDTLLAKGHSVDLLSLYNERFDEVLSRDKQLNYHDEARNITPAIAPYVERVRMAEAIVIVHPRLEFRHAGDLEGLF